MNHTSSSRFDTPEATDNRCYDYSGAPELSRDEYPIIEQWIPSGSSVLDLGCGNGSLLKRLSTRGVHGLGWDNSPSGIQACRASGIDAEVRAIDRLHPDIADKSYDFTICNVTLQMTMRPEVLFAEMVRIGRRQIVSFPNFGHYRNRLDFLRWGRMPIPLLFGYSWYSTGHIHQLSVSDFYGLVEATGGTRIQEVGRLPSRTLLGQWLRTEFPNLFELIPIFLLG